ncbi:MAG TPA: amino acid adenylation domain-containing protein, partial [Blastocatellia bacterium]|nr:amino acid adenylation domain-containing protein [Blastocatellia bacterium]
ISMSLPAQPKSNRTESVVEEPQFLHQFFERSVHRCPERIALDLPPGNGRPERVWLTYEELGRRADALACFLGRFVSGECVVAIFLPRRAEHLYISQLAVLKAGACYTCIDPEFPDQQIGEILEDAGAVALLTDAAGLARVDQFGYDGGRAFDVAELAPRFEGTACERPSHDWLTPGSLAYTIYTSGTTGRPKGVMIEHASVTNLVGSDAREFALTPADRVAQSSSPAYDSSVEEIWLAFAAGATVVVMDEDAVRQGPDLIDWLRRERITVFCPPPTLLRATRCEDPAAALPELSLLYVGGEALPRDIADRWSRGRRLENGYGPTECTVTALRGTITEDGDITIGSPVSGLRAWVLDDSLEEVPAGEPGELCLGGVGLARGYHNRPELTGEKFPVHPRLGRIYRTGDLVHRGADGRYHYHGRIDSQVKLRGYRIELEAIEARLAECAGVREVACRVQQDGAQQSLVAFIVPENGFNPEFVAGLKASLRAKLPAYMIPGRFAALKELPTTVGGKLNRNALPFVETNGDNGRPDPTLPRDGMEKRLYSAFREVLRLNGGVSVDDDFFNDLGGDSLHAAELISLLRDDPATSWVTVRDLYEGRSVAELAKRVRADEGAATAFANETHTGQGRPLLATAVQTIWIAIGVLIGSSLMWLTAFQAVPWLLRSLAITRFILIVPLLTLGALCVYAPLSVLLAALVKKVVIGRYRPMNAPVWGSFYVRNWMVHQTVRLIPWALLEGTVFQIIALRLLGARIGKRVHIHRGVDLLQGGWDLLEIGDDVTLSQDASLRLVELADGQVIVGSVSIGARSTLDVRAGVGANTVIGSDAYLTTLSGLADGERIPSGECWSGIPARSAGPAPARPPLTNEETAISAGLQGAILVLSRLTLLALLATPFQLSIIAAAQIFRISTGQALDWLVRPSLNWLLLIIAGLVAIISVPTMVALEALLMRAMGQVRAGVISRWGLSYVRVWLKTRILHLAGDWLAGTLFWPIWLRLAGMKLDSGCEISTIMDVVPELITIGRNSFLADGIYIGGPLVHRGTVTLQETRLGKNTFTGNHVVIAGGQQLPDDVLFGVCTVADDRIVRPGTAWFGHPPFELPRREVIECDRSLTHEPKVLRYLNRVFWEALRFTLWAVPAMAILCWYKITSGAVFGSSPTIRLLTVVPLITLGLAAFFCLLVLATKWMLLGRVRPGIHPFWSCWCCRWDFVYVVWEFYARALLSALEGTLLLSWYLRGMGMRIGRRVVLGGGFAQVVDPDMLHFEDGATVSCQFQAHTFEDRVLKIDRVRIGRQATVGHVAVLLYGAQVGDYTNVAPQSVVMKRESLLSGRSYAGSPTQPVTNQ